MLKLRSIILEDLEGVMKWRTSESVTKYMYTDPKLTLEIQYAWYDSLKEDESKQYWIIELDDQPIGVINLYDIDKANNHCFWAYYIAETAAKGKGVARHLECNIYDYVFYKLGLNKLSCEVFTFNDLVVNIHKKFGSEVEGFFKEHIQKNGQYYDIVRMAILKSKWDVTRSSYEYNLIDIDKPFYL